MKWKCGRRVRLVPVGARFGMGLAGWLLFAGALAVSAREPVTGFPLDIPAGKGGGGDDAPVLFRTADLGLPFSPEAGAVIDPVLRRASVPLADPSAFFRLASPSMVDVVDSVILNDRLELSYRDLAAPDVDISSPFFFRLNLLELEPPAPLPVPEFSEWVVLDPFASRSGAKIEAVPYLSISDITAERMPPSSSHTDNCAVSEYRFTFRIKNIGAAAVTADDLPGTLHATFSQPKWDEQEGRYLDGVQHVEFPSGSWGPVIGLVPNGSIEVESKSLIPRMNPFRVRADIIDWTYTPTGRVGTVRNTLERDFPGHGPDLRHGLFHSINPCGVDTWVGIGSNRMQVVRDAAWLNFTVLNAGNVATPSRVRLKVVVPQVGIELDLFHTNACLKWEFLFDPLAAGESVNTLDKYGDRYASGFNPNHLIHTLQGDPDYNRIHFFLSHHCDFGSGNFGGTGYDADLRDNQVVVDATQVSLAQP